MDGLTVFGERVLAVALGVVRVSVVGGVPRPRPARRSEAGPVVEAPATVEGPSYHGRREAGQEADPAQGRSPGASEAGPGPGPETGVFG